MARAVRTAARRCGVRAKTGGLAGTAGERQADAIAGWESVTVNLSDVPPGMRHVMITLDGNGKLLSASDPVLLQRKEPRGRDIVSIYDQETVGGRFEEDGSFRGTRWITRTEQIDATTSMRA